MFVVASFAKDNPEIIERMKKEEHLIGLHSFEHKNALKDDILVLINDHDIDEDTESIREIAEECYKNCGF